MKEKDFCFILQPKADTQGSKIPFRDYRWVGPYIVQKVLPIDNYIIRRLNTNKTQILHRIRLKKFVPNKPLEDGYQNEKLQADEEINIPQDDRYTISWESNFGEQLENTISNNWTNSSTRTSVNTPIVLVPRERINSNTSEQHEANNDDAAQYSPKVSPHDVIGRTPECKRTNNGRTDVIIEDTSNESKNDAESTRIIPSN